ncbi:MAG: bifunctional adenosylcobinamide kinase/adenosylcobinamide-phosphate guanylyltransferase [Pseudomonadota bacterium]
MKTLILGGVRSGKSALAERLAEAHGGPVTVIATATAFDDEMQARIDAHRATRPATWRTVEAPVELPDALRAASAADTLVLVDCLTLWLTNLLIAEPPADLDAAHDALLDALASAPGDTVLVSNENSFGVTPDNRLSRAVLDTAGRLHQRIAARADRVALAVAGLPLTLKGPPL